MDRKVRFLLLISLSVMLNVIAVFLLLGAFEILGSIPRIPGIAGFAVCVILSGVASLFAVFGYRKG